MPDSGIAILFPGQGAQSDGMLAEIVGYEGFHARYETLRDTLGYDLIASVRSGKTSVHANLAGSLLAVLAGVLSLDVLRRDESLADSIVGAAGYSVGQWVALYAAGALSFEQLIRIVHRRAVIMDECVAVNPGSMIAVIGTSEADLEQCCATIRDRGLFAAIANYNAVGQYTLSIEQHAVATVMSAVQTLKPIKWVQLQAAGPWHSELMAPARDSFAGFLEQEHFHVASIPTVDNTTGGFMPAAVASCRQTLADQLCQPVRWSRGVETLIARGATRCIEVGYGNMLTKFGFFIDRRVQHVTLHSFLA